MIKKYLHQSLKNSKGFSLIEGLVGVGLVAGLAVMVAQFGVQRKPVDRVATARTCDSVAQGAVDAIKRRGIYNQILNVNPVAGVRALPFPPFSHAPFVADTDLWPTEVRDVNTLGGYG